MKNFSKILILILAVVTLFTLMAVVALAEETDAVVLEPQLHETAPSSYNKWDSMSVGDEAGEKSTALDASGVPANYGSIKVTASDDGNQYGLFTTSSNKGNNNFRDMYTGYPRAKDNPELTRPEGHPINDCHQYNIYDYPYFVLNYDVMTPTGNFGSHVTINYRIYQWAQANNKSASVDFANSHNANIPGLDATPYNWQHVTIVVKFSFEMDPATDLPTKMIATTKYFVNGVETGGVDQSYTGKFINYCPQDLCVQSVRFGLGKASGPNTQAMAIDNQSVSNFPASWKVEDIVAKVLETDKELPYRTTKATIGEGDDTMYFDDINEAIAAAEAGQIIKLHDNVELAEIEKPVIIDTNKYGEDGNATGERYGLTFVSSKYLPNGENGKGENGVISFNAVQNASTFVYWDDCPGLAAQTDCTCEGLYADHLMALETEAMLYSMPQFKGDIPEFEVINKKSFKFVGWSYTQGGEVEELRPITAEDVENGYLSLYPVYEELNYYVTVIDGETETDYLDTELAFAISKAPAGATIRLNGDITVTAQLAFGKDLTFDLNGYTMSAYRYSVTDYKAVLDEATGEYVAGDQINAVSGGSNPYFFYFNSKGFTFNFKSSRPGAQVINGGAKVVRLFDDEGNMVKETVTNYGGSFISLYPAPININIYGEGITFYVNNLIYGEHGGNNADLSVNIDGGTYIRNNNSTEGMLALRRGGTHTVKNAKFYLDNGYLASGYYDKSTQITFENCEIYDAYLYLKFASETQIFNNCIVTGTVAAGEGKFVFGKGTKTNISTDKYTASGASVVEVSSVARNVAVYMPHLAYTEDYTGYTGLGEFATADIYYSSIVTDDPASIATVEWKNAKGEVVATKYALVGYEAYAGNAGNVVIDNAYLNAQTTKWLDAEGNVADLVIDEAAKYEFYIPAELGEDAIFVAGIKDARLSFSYYSQFMMHFYLPVVEGMERPVISAANDSSNTVLIDGEEFWLYTFYCSTATVVDAKTINVVYTIDEVVYTQSYAISALVYADIVLADPASDAEALAVANMIRYIKEARVVASLDTAACDALLAKAELPAYATEYPNADVTIGDVAKYVEYFNLKIAGGTPAFAFKISEAGVAAGVTLESFKIVTESGVALEIYTYDEGVTYQTNNVKVYNANELLNITVTVPAAEEGAEATVVTGQYSLGAYIKGVEAQEQNADLAKALNAFAIAAKAYRDSRTDY